MSEAKSFASLSSGLLARKGAARPAMRPQGFGQFSSSMEDLGWNDMGHLPEPSPAPAFTAPRQERVLSPIAPLTPVNVEEEVEEAFEPAPPIVEQQRAAIEASFGEAASDRMVLATKAKKPALEAGDADEEQDEADVVDFAEQVVVAKPVQPIEVQPKVEPKAAARAKAAFTLRLEADRHLKLRLACAVTGRSAQQLVTEALDQLLKSKPEVEALAGQLPGTSH